MDLNLYLVLPSIEITNIVDTTSLIDYLRLLKEIKSELELI